MTPLDLYILGMWQLYEFDGDLGGYNTAAAVAFSPRVDGWLGFTDFERRARAQCGGHFPSND